MSSDTYLTRETLIKRVSNLTDEEAWEEFYQFYEAFIYSIIWKMDIPEQDVEDLFQRIMVNLWEALPSFDYAQKRGKFRNWLYTVTRNEVLAYLNSKMRYKKHKENIQLSGKNQKSEGDVDTLIKQEWELHLAAMAFKNIEKKVSKLSIDVFLATLKNEAISAIAERLSLSENSVYVYKMRVKNALAAEVEALKEFLE